MTRQPSAPNRHSRRRLLCGVLGGVAATTASRWTFAATPPLRLIVGFAAGGPIDLGARAIAPLLEDRLKQTVIVDNKPGGAGVIAVQSLLNAPADGNTLYLQSASVISDVFIKDFRLDVRGALQPVAPVWTVSYYLIAGPALPAGALPEVIRYAKANGRTLNYGSPTSSSMLIMEILKAKAGFEATQIPFRGSAPTAAAMLAGDVQITIDAISAYRQHIEAGKLRLLAYTGGARSPLFPAIPSLAEAGYPDATASLTGGLWARHGTSPSRIAQIAAASNECVTQANVRQSFERNGWLAQGGTSEALLKQTADEMSFWRRGAALINFKPE